MHPFALAVILALSVAVFVFWRRWRRLARETYIRDYAFPKGLFDRLAKRRPDLSLKDRGLVARGLRQFFLAYLRGGGRYVSMPSQVADDLWHEFILYTRNYEAFCKQAFGRFLHHTPAVVLGDDRKSNEGLRRCWYWCCREENIDPKKPTRLPLLFALDTKLGIADGFRYVPDCKALAPGQSGSAHCAGDFGSASTGCGGDGGLGDISFGDGGFGDGGDAGGGSGCGGGCGGGGD